MRRSADCARVSLEDLPLRTRAQPALREAASILGWQSHGKSSGTNERMNAVAMGTVELYRTLEKAHAAGRAAAAAGPSLGVERTAPAPWVAELWELWGDGRALIGPLQRKLLVSQLLAAADGFSDTAGTVALMASFLARCGTAAATERPGDGERFTPGERAVLSLGRRYRDALRERALREPDEAARQLAVLAGEGAMPRAAVVAVDPVDGTPGLEELLAAMAGGPADAADGEPFALPPLPAGVEPRMAYAAGPTIVASVVLGEVEDALDRGCRSVLVCAPRPEALFEAVSPALAQRRPTQNLRYRIPFGETYLGRALACVPLPARDFSVERATDFALNPLACVPWYTAQELNTMLRKDRLAGFAEADALLCEGSATYRDFASLAAFVSGEGGSAVGARGALGRVRERLDAIEGLSPGEWAREARAAESLAGLLEAADELAVDAPCFSAVLDGLSVAVTLQSGEGRDADGGPGVTVEFAAMDRLDSLLAGSWDAVVLGDVSQAAFPVTACAGALDELAAKLGCPVDDDPFEAGRRRFAAAMGASRRRFTCVLCQRDGAGEETYPAFMLGEYEERLAGPVVVERGEDALVAGCGHTFEPVAFRKEWPPVARGELRELHLGNFLPTAEAEGRRCLVMSPSAVESYLACPYRWFIEKRVAPAGIDEGFDALGKGSFIHQVFARFYDDLASRGVARVTPENLGEAEGAFGELFDRLLAEQPQRNPGDGRLVTTGKAEAVEVGRLRGAALECLRRQARFAPGYDICGHEIAIGDDGPVPYGGVLLRGRADRVDVDRANHRFAVIDYKGSVGASYAANVKADEEPGLPRKIQAAMYAQVLRTRFQNLHCAGALYLSYSAKSRAGFAAGAADDTFDDNGFLAQKSRVPLNFEAYLDAVEQQAAVALAGLYADDIAVRPRDSDACTFCPAVYCEGRLS